MKARAKALTPRETTLVLGFIAAMLVMAAGAVHLHGLIRTSLAPQALEPQVPAPLAAGLKDSHSGLGAHATGAFARTPGWGDMRSI